MTSLILAGLGVAGVALTARVLTRSLREVQKRAASLPKSPMFTSYYKGGFAKKMSRREAGLILGISPSSGKERIGEAHKKIMLLNHPDRGGSPYMAAKVHLTV
ncbi:DnaJ homolog subfamily C member 15 [Geodia barretti]|uniref:DnaJ homolog subfamily C member 15 n=1 Tax=Geodia barretti TaxID=519541 RepID=A0AA35TY86_GEOBA|nr:DnaJ homolog subfamily C member 15 [Geodia barretti]